jgi:hypothetical protein
LEYHFQEMFNFRLGYRGAEDNSGATMGLGVHYESFALDFAMSLGGAVYNTTQVSFSYKFAAWQTAEIKKKARQYRAPSYNPEKKQPEKKTSRPEQKKKTDSDFFWIY